MITYNFRFFPAAGDRKVDNGDAQLRSQYGFYWSSATFDADRRWHAIFSGADIGLSNWRGPFGFSIRCVAKVISHYSCF